MRPTDGRNLIRPSAQAAGPGPFAGARRARFRIGGPNPPLMSTVQRKRADESASDAQFLDRNGVTAYMKDVVTLLLESRPEDPLQFVAD